MGLCSCLASCLAQGVQHWSLLVVGWSQVLVLRWRSLGELLLINIPWGQEFSGGPTSWTQLCHLRGSSLTPGQSTKTLKATQCRRKEKRKKENQQTNKTSRQMVNTKPNRQKHTRKHTHIQKQGEKRENKKEESKK